MCTYNEHAHTYAHINTYILQYMYLFAHVQICVCAGKLTMNVYILMHVLGTLLWVWFIFSLTIHKHPNLTSWTNQLEQQVSCRSGTWHHVR